MAPAPPGPAMQAQVSVSPGTTVAKRITRDSTGGFILPDGTRVAGDQNGGFALPNGDYVAPDGLGGLRLPNGSRCTADGPTGYICP